MPAEWNNVNNLPDDHVRIDPHAFQQMQSLYNQTYIMMKNSINDYTLDFDWFLKKLTKNPDLQKSPLQVVLDQLQSTSQIRLK